MTFIFVFATLAMTTRREGPAMLYDLLLTDGEVLDPGAGLKGRMDVGITGGKIAAVGPNLPRNEARAPISAKGHYVTPGLVDIHAHVFVNAHDMGGMTDHFCRHSGVTTLCDAGSAGSAGFAGLRHVLDHHVRTRVRAFVNLSAIGIIGGARGTGPGDRRQAAFRAGAGVGILERAGQART
jgi:dihydroorotase